MIFLATPFLNDIPRHTIQSIYYTIISHLQFLIWSSFQHLHGLHYTLLNIQIMGGSFGFHAL